MSMRHRVLTLLLSLAVALTAGAVSARDKWAKSYEDKVGKEAIEQVRKEYKVYDDPEQLKRLQTMVDAIKAVSHRPDVTYQIFLLDTEEENAFSIPGGYICVTKALLNSAQSDHQIAGVLAHEMAHNCTYDALNEAEKARKLSMPVLAAVVATIVTGKNSDTVSAAMLGGLYVAHSILSTYSQEVEAQADTNAVLYLLKSGQYDPVGLLTFMEHLAIQERTRPPVDYGIFKTHPFSTLRVACIAAMIRAADRNINRRAVTKWDPPSLVATKIGEQDAQTLTLWKQPLLTFNFAPAGSDAAARGAAMVQALTAALAEGAEVRDFTVDLRAKPLTLMAMGKPLAVLYPEDAALNETNPEELAAEFMRGIKAALYNESLARMFGPGPAPVPPPPAATPAPAPLTALAP